MKSALPIIVATFIAFGTSGAVAQLRLARSPADDGIVAAASDQTPPATIDADAQQQRSFRWLPGDLRLRNAALIAGGALLVGAYGKAKWWDEGFTGRFRTENEHWFGQNTRSGGADKLGHAFSAYAGTRLLTRGFEVAGNEPRQALNLGFWSTLGIMTAIEVADGYSRQYRFSPHDAIMNVVGAGVGYLMERNPDLDRLVDLRLLYKTSQNSSFDPAGDYSGQTYLLVLKASGVPALRTHEPLRYFELAFGYGTRGYENLPTFERSRNLYIGVSLNVSELLRQTVYRGNSSRSIAQKGTAMFFEYIQVPGTAALSRHRL
jgi:hypothetical protein